MIDIRTLLFANAIVFAVLAVAVILVWRVNRTFPGLASLARVHVAIMAGAIFVGLDPGVVPAIVSAIAGNALVVLGILWLLQGMRGLYGLPRDPWPRIVLPLWGAGMVVSVYLLPSLRARILVTSVAVIVLLLKAVWTVRHGFRTREDRGPSLLIFGSLGLLEAVYTARCVRVALSERVESLGSDPFTLALVIASLIAGTGWTLGVMNLVYARLNEATRRSRAEIAHREAIGRALLDSIPDLMFRVSAGGILREVHAPKGGLFTLHPGELLDAPAAEALPPDVARLLLDVLARAGETGDPVTFEFRLPAGDGTERDWEARVSPTPPLDEFIVLSRDVTAHKRYEAALEELVQVAAHELRSPLTSILGTLRLLAARGEALSGMEKERLLEAAQRNSERMGKLIDDLLDLERVESGQALFELGPVDLGALLRQAREVSEGHAHQLGVSIELAELPEPADVRVLADPQRLLQVLVNLLSNAVKFSPPGESVRVNVARSGGWVRVEVWDRGPGIPRELRTRIFQKFARAAVPGAAGSRTQGSGLGLAISKAFIDEMGGKIGFETEEGAGTAFYFELPAVGGDP